MYLLSIGKNSQENIKTIKKTPFNNQISLSQEQCLAKQAMAAKEDLRAK